MVNFEVNLGNEKALVAKDNFEVEDDTLKENLDFKENAYVMIISSKIEE